MNKKAFSLIEIMVAVTIIGLLSAAAVLGFNKSRIKSREIKRITDISQLSDAVNNYYSLYDAYPAQDSGLDKTIDQSLSVLISKGLVKTLPKDPKPAYGGGTGDNRCYNYTYASPREGRLYKVAFGAEVAGINGRHPYNSNVQADGISGCNISGTDTRADGRIYGPK